MRTDRVEFLDLAFDRLTFRQVKDRLRSVTAESPYGYVITPNVDHIVRLRREPDLQHLYDNARLCVCDSRILRFLARLSGINLPLVPGSDLAAGVLSSVIKPSDRIAVIGATNELVDRLLDLYPHIEIVHHTPPMGLRANAKAREEAAKFIASSNARFTFLTVGSPQQELIANEARTIAGAGGMALCVGAGLEFLTGEQKRAPRALPARGSARRRRIDPRGRASSQVQRWSLPDTRRARSTRSGTPRGRDRSRAVDTDIRTPRAVRRRAP